MAERVTPTEWFRGIARGIAEHVSVEEAREIVVSPGIQEEIVRLTVETDGHRASLEDCQDVAKMTYQAYKLRAEEQDPEDWHAFYFPRDDGSRTLGFSCDFSAVYKVVPGDGVPIPVAGSI